MDIVLENERLRDLVAVARENKDFYDDFLNYVINKGYNNVHSFVMEDDKDRGYKVILDYLNRDNGMNLYNGVLDPYNPSKSKWFFLAWLLRDAPAQRLQPILKHVPGDHYNERRAYLLNEVRDFLQPLYPDERHWQWTPIAEVMIDRLEGSRRAARGTLYERIVSRNMSSVFEDNGLDLEISDKEVEMEGETYDLHVSGSSGTLLVPIKTRETMGGGHASLFTRDIKEAIRVAENNGYTCLPIVIAEAWGGNLESLDSDRHIRIKANPNQISNVESVLQSEIEEVIDSFNQIS
ncbi:hypothetical protein [Salinibacter ruber]|jgi:hypothetical protein|uniref:hypothetical protein n=1 Tax=Salinibacter ruber TaxID=146919 RepID=UPI00216A7C23|nr:hypothetical protein [Salinibacter ruber]MCS4182169.1 hypothetical protein [Salinibacter ruber]